MKNVGKPAVSATLANFSYEYDEVSLILTTKLKPTNSKAWRYWSTAKFILVNQEWL